ncbi:hypothetical protein [Azospirillum canadense]|uniref:hypothetical protein n=1 Tax=Azospirillum canadense TaxID=403962 RepID=UPI0022264A89|nr:hypothetical protein [Azospirillum canadense]MCW2242768.1 hypothetical protein [Azospirillum canadense]
MSKHTPGPWTVEQEAADCPIDIIGGNGAVLATVLGAQEQCQILSETQTANATLIAAAPDLLATLQKIAEVQVQNYGDATRLHLRMIELTAEASTVIAKAICSTANGEAAQ